MPLFYITGAYMLRNKVNGKVYVGGAYESFTRRKKKHYIDLRGNKHFNMHLQRAWNKYGEQAFEWIILERCHPKLVEETEQKYLNLYEAGNHNLCYNVNPKARTRKGATVSEESKAKISAAKTGVYRGPHSKEHKANISKSNKGRKRTEQARKNVSEGNRRRFSTVESRIEHGKSQQKRFQRKEERGKISKAVTNLWQDPEYRNRVTASHIGKKPSEEARQRMRVSQQARRLREKLS